MTPGQREPDRGMIETCAQPRVDGVAQFALLGKAGRHMIRSIGLLEGALMARVALGRQSLELSDSFTLVAVRAIKPCMPTNERKAVLMFPHPLQNDVPSFHSVALGTVGPHLAAVDVGVAVGTVRARI